MNCDLCGDVNINLVRDLTGNLSKMWSREIIGSGVFYTPCSVCKKDINICAKCVNRNALLKKYELEEKVMKAHDEIHHAVDLS